MNKTKRTGIFFPQFAETGVQIISDFVNIEIPEKVNMPKNLFHVLYDPLEEGIQVLFQCDWDTESPLYVEQWVTGTREFPLLIVCHEDSNKRFDAPCMKLLWAHTHIVAREDAVSVIRESMELVRRGMLASFPNLMRTSCSRVSGELLEELYPEN